MSAQTYFGLTDRFSRAHFAVWLLSAWPYQHGQHALPERGFGVGSSALTLTPLVTDYEGACLCVNIMQMSCER